MRRRCTNRQFSFPSRHLNLHRVGRFAVTVEDNAGIVRILRWGQVRYRLASGSVSMNEQIKAQIETKPFQRFFIDINDGRSVEVPHPDHVIVGRFAVTVEDDAGIVRILAYRNISGLTVPTANNGEPPVAP